MKKTAKYTKACQLLIFPHDSQDDLYAELNRLGFYWNKQDWIRDDTPPKDATKLIKIRVWAATDLVVQASELLIESFQSDGLRLIEKSSPYQCRPPLQKESRVYLSFLDLDEDAHA